MLEDEPREPGQSPELVGQSPELVTELDLPDLPGCPHGRTDTPFPPPLATYVRDLTEADLDAPPTVVPPRAIMRIHASHHALARCLATGMRPAQAALVTGYSPGRISSLKNDPAFTALVEDYRQEAKSVFADLAERMHDLSLDAVEILQERLHGDPESFSIPALLDMVKTFADRTGHGPGQELHIKTDKDFVDRPPRETFEEWSARRATELKPRPREIEGSIKGDAGSVPLNGTVLPPRRLN